MSSEKEDREANLFAMSLLMPEKLVRKWMADHGPLDLCDDDMLKKLAKDFAVPLTVAVVRLANLKFFQV